MAKRRFSFAPPQDKKFAETFFLVEATSFERHCLWMQYHRKVSWQNEMGCMGQIGVLGNRPVVLSVFWARIDGKLVGFWEMTSQVADFEMAKKWLSKNCTPPKWDNGRRVPQSNAENFHNCIDAIKEANARKSTATPA